MNKKAILYMVISAIAFTLMNVTAKKLTHFGTYQIVFFRSLGTLIFTASFLLYNRISFFGSEKKLLLLRSFVGFISMSFFFMSLKYLPVGSAVTLRYLAPIFAAVIAVIILKERILFKQWLFAILAFSGVIVLKYADIQINTIGLAIILVSAFFGGMVYIAINKIGTREHPITVVNHFMLFCVLIGGILSFFDWEPTSKSDFLPLFSLGIYGFFGQLYMTKAFQIEVVNRIAPIKYLEVIFTVSIGIILFKETYTFWSLLGIVMILSGLILNIIFKKNT